MKGNPRFRTGKTAFRITSSNGMTLKTTPKDNKVGMQTNYAQGTC